MAASCSLASSPLSRSVAYTLPHLRSAPRVMAPVRVSASASPLGGLGGNHHPQEHHGFTSLFSLSFIPPTCNPNTVLDARDALEACGGLFGEARDDCLAVFGIDAARTDSYYTAVSALEAALERDTEPEEEASHRGQERC